MNVLKYIIYLIKGSFTARIAPTPAMTEADYLAAVSAGSGKPVADVTAVLDAMRALHITLGKQGRGTDIIRDFYRVMTTLGGVYPTNDPAATLVKANVDQNIPVVPSVIEAIQDGLSVEKTGEKTQHEPDIDSILGQPGNVLNKYGVGTTGGTQVNGTYFRESRADSTWPTVQLINADGTGGISLAVIQCTPGKLVLGPAPAGTTGAKRLRITATYGSGPVVTSTEEIAPL